MGFFQISGGIFFGFWVPLIAITLIAKYGQKVTLDQRIMKITDKDARLKALKCFQDAVGKGDLSTLAMINKRVTEILKEEKHGLARHQSGH